MKRKMLFCQNYGTNLATNLVAYYAFEGNANDSINAHNGTLVGSPTFPSGKHNLGVNFGNDGVSRYVDIPDNDDFSFTNGTNDVPFSISMWVNFTSFNTVTGGGNAILPKMDASGNNEYNFIFYEGNKLFFIKWSNGGLSNYQGIISTSNPFTLGIWHHLVYTDNGTATNSGMKFYVDGNLVPVTNYNGGTYVKMANTTFPARIGMSSWGDYTFFQHKGLLDELAIWKNRELTSAEVLELYNSGAGKFNPF